MGVDTKGTKVKIDQGLQELLKEKYDSLDLGVKLNKKDLAGLKKLLSGDEIATDLFKSFSAKIVALQKDMANKYLPNDKKSNVSEFAKVQQKEVLDKVAERTKGKNLTALEAKTNVDTNELMKLKVSYEDIDGTIKYVNATLRDGEIILEETVRSVSSFDAELKKVRQTISALYKQETTLKENMIKSGSSEVEIQESLLNIEQARNAEKEKYTKILNSASGIGTMDDSAKKQREQILANLEIQEKTNSERALAATAEKKNSDEGIRASNKLIKNQAAIAAIEKQMVLDGKANLSVMKTKIDTLKKENIQLQKAVDLSEEAKRNVAENSKTATSAASQKVEERFSNKYLNAISAANKKAVKEYKILDIAKKTGNADDYKASKQKLAQILKERSLIIQLAKSQIQDADVKMDYERRLGLLRQERIQDMKIIKSEALAIAHAEESRIAETYGSADSKLIKEKRPSSALTDDEINKVSRSQKEFLKLAQEVIGAKTELVHFNNEVQEGGRILATGTVKLKQADGTYKQFQMSVDGAGKQLLLTNEIVKNGSKVNASFAERMATVFRKLTAYVGVSTLIYGALNKIREGFSFIFDLDKQLTQTAITFGMTKSQTDALGESYSRMAIRMGKTTMEIAEANTELVRQGLSLKESKKRLEEVIKLSAVGAISTGEALKVITTGVNAMKVSAKEISDVLVYAGQLSASSVEELGEAFQKVASSAYASNMRLTETAAILATITEVTQEDASSVGTSLKTMIARFNNITDEASDMGEELNKVQTAIESVGIKFTDSAGQVRNLFDILKDLNDIWGTLDKNTKSYIATQAAGTRQQNKFFAVMDNYNRVLELNNELTTSAGKLSQGYEVYLQSLEAQSNKTKASLEALWQEDIFPQLIGAFNNMALAVLSVVKGLGLLETAAVGISAYVLLGEASKILTVSMSAAGTALAGGATATAAMTTGLAALLPAFLTALPIIAAVGVAIGLVYTGLKNYANEQKNIAARQADATEKAQTLTKAFLSQESTLNDLTEMSREYNELSAKIGSGSAKAKLNSEEYARFLELTDSIKTILPEVSKAENKSGESIIQLSKDRKVLNGILEKQIELQREAFVGSAAQLEYEKAEQKKFEDYNNAKEKALQLEKKIKTAQAQPYRQNPYGTKALEDKLINLNIELANAKENVDFLYESIDVAPFLNTFAAINNIKDETVLATFASEEFKETVKNGLLGDAASDTAFMEGLLNQIEEATPKLNELYEEQKRIDTLIGGGDVSSSTRNAISVQLKIINDELKIATNPVTIEGLKTLAQEYQNFLNVIRGKANEGENPSIASFSALEKKMNALIELKEQLSQEEANPLGYNDLKKLEEAGFNYGEVLADILATEGDVTKQKALLAFYANEEYNDEKKRLIENLKVNKAIRDRIAALREEGILLQGLTGEEGKRARLANSYAILAQAKREMPTDTDDIIDESTDSLMNAFLQAGSGASSAKESLEKYFDTLEKISASQQKLDRLAFEDDELGFDREKERTTELKNLSALYQSLEKQRRANLAKINSELKKTSVNSKKYIELRQEAREEQEALNDLMMDQIAIEMRLIEVRESKFDTYKEQNSNIESLNSKLSLFDAQGDKGLTGKLAMTELLIQAEEDIIKSKIIEQELLRKEAAQLNLTQNQRILLLDKIKSLEMEIDTHKANIIGYSNDALAVDERRKEMLEEERNGMRDLLGLVEDMVRSEEEQLIATREERLRLAKEELDIQLKSLETEKDRDDFERSRLDKVADINKIKQKMASLEIAAATGDTKAANKLLNLQDDLIEKEKELDTFIREDSFKKQKEGIQEVYDTLEKEIEDANRESQAFLNNMEAVMARVQGRINDHLNGSIDLYQQLMDWNRKHGTGIDVDVTKKWDLAYVSLQKYLELAKTFDVNDFMNNYKGQTPATSGGSDKDNLTFSQNTTLEKMKYNSQAWKTATTQKDKDYYASLNQGLGVPAGFVFDPSSGRWFASLADQAAGIKLYDNGVLKPKGEKGMMAEGVKEWIFDDNQLKSIQKMAIAEYVRMPDINSSSPSINITIEGSVTDENLGRITSDMKDIVTRVSQGQLDSFRSRGIKPTTSAR